MKSSIRIILAAALLSSVLFSVIAPDTVHALGPPASVIEVYPSGDTSGATDYLNIQNAMDSLEPGGKVVLADGHFYINAGIVVEGFDGTLQGSLQGRRLQTTIEAVAPFSYTHATNYLPFDPQTYFDPVFPSMLFFEFPENKVEVKDLILQALAPDYVEPRPYWGTTTTALIHFIADFGGDVDVTYKNLELIAAQGDYFGSNVAIGIHSMRGPGCDALCDRELDPSLHGSGNAVFTEIALNNVRDYSILPMWYRDGTMKIADISSDAMVGPYGMINMQTDITNVYSAGSWRTFGLGYAAGGHTTIKGLMADGGWCPAILLINAENVDIRDSGISGCNGFDAWWRNPILIATGNHNITIADNVFTDIRNVSSAVLVLPGRNNTEILIRDNYYDPSYFTGPPGPWAVQLGSDDSLVIEPSLTPEQVRDLGENNTLILGED
jgi:hypothetical protein